MNNPKKSHCGCCLYSLGVIKYIESPCPKCVVFGGPNKPITAASWSEENKMSEKPDRERRKIS